MKVLVTGGSGLLGRSVMKMLMEEGHQVVGTAFSRTKGNLVKLDLEDEVQVRLLMRVHDVLPSFQSLVDVGQHGTRARSLAETGRAAAIFDEDLATIRIDNGAQVCLCLSWSVATCRCITNGDLCFVGRIALSWAKDTVEVEL